MSWEKLSEKLPHKPSSRPVLLYHPDMGDMPMTALHGDLPFRVTNRSYARTEAIHDGFTLWMEIPEVKA